MSNGWKLHYTPDDTIFTEIVSGANITSKGFANGRAIPVIFVQSDPERKIENLIHIHKGINNGNCNSQWGMSMRRDKPFLHLSFSSPVQINICITFDVLKYGLFVDQILYSQCMFLAIGEPDCSLSQNLECEKILLEIPETGFFAEWEKLYPKMFCKYMKKKHRISKRVALSQLEKMRYRYNLVKRIRIT